MLMKEEIDSNKGPALRYSEILEKNKWSGRNTWMNKWVRKKAEKVVEKIYGLVTYCKLYEKMTEQLSDYILFVREEFECPGNEMSYKEVLMEKKWETLSEKEKLKWQLRNFRLRKTYKEDFKNFCEGFSTEEIQDFEQNRKEIELNKRAFLHSDPARRTSEFLDQTQHVELTNKKGLWFKFYL